MKNSETNKPGVILFKSVLAFLLFLLSGIASTYLYCRFYHQGGGIIPGLLYTSATVLVFTLFNIKINTGRIAVYYVLMVLTYVLIWFLTLFSSWFAAIVGIGTAGAGAVLTFMLVNKYILTIKYERVIIFSLGGLAFLITDILNMAFQKSPVEMIFKFSNSIETVFTEVFVCWQLIVGIALVLAVKKQAATFESAASAETNP